MAPHMRLNSFWSADWDFHWRTVKRSQHLPERPNATAIHRGHQSLTLQLIFPVSWLETSETISTPTCLHFQWGLSFGQSSFNFHLRCHPTCCWGKLGCEEHFFSKDLLRLTELIQLIGTNPCGTIWQLLGHCSLGKSDETAQYPSE